MKPVVDQGGNITVTGKSNFLISTVGHLYVTRYKMNSLKSFNQM